MMKSPSLRYSVAARRKGSDRAVHELSSSASIDAHVSWSDRRHPALLNWLCRPAGSRRPTGLCAYARGELSREEGRKEDPALEGVTADQRPRRAGLRRGCPRRNRSLANAIDSSAAEAKKPVSRWHFAWIAELLDQEEFERIAFPPSSTK